MKIIIDILDEEYMPECPHCEKPVDINGEIDFGDLAENSMIICDKCLHFFDAVFIVRQAEKFDDTLEED